MTRGSARLLVAGTAAALFVGLLSAQQAPADTPATRQLARWLESFNAANRDVRQRFVAEHWPTRPNQNVDQDLAFREQTGGSICSDRGVDTDADGCARRGTGL